MQVRVFRLLGWMALAILCAEGLPRPTPDKTTGSDRLQNEFTKRCQELCASDEVPEDLKPDCQRGCQYFNLHFLVGASNKKKVTDIKHTAVQCLTSCNQALENPAQGDACACGCKRMQTLQNQAPYINGWLVYMGASDKNVVLLQPDYDIPTTEDWVLLDSVLRNSEYADHSFDTYLGGEPSDRLVKVYTPASSTSITGHCDLSLVECRTQALLGMGCVVMLVCICILMIDPFRRDRKKNPHTSVTVKEYLVTAPANTYFYPMPAVPPPENTDTEKLLDN